MYSKNIVTWYKYLNGMSFICSPFSLSFSLYLFWYFFLLLFFSIFPYLPLFHISFFSYFSLSFSLYLCVISLVCPYFSFSYFFPALSPPKNVLFSVARPSSPLLVAGPLKIELFTASLFYWGNRVRLTLDRAENWFSP